VGNKGITKIGIFEMTLLGKTEILEENQINCKSGHTWPGLD